MIFSLLIAFTVTPWAAVHILKKDQLSGDDVDSQGHHMPDDFFTRLYHRIMDPLLARGSMRILFFVIIVEHSTCFKLKLLGNVHPPTPNTPGADKKKTGKMVVCAQ